MATYYVSANTGDDTNDGSLPVYSGGGQGPFATIQKAVDTIGAVDGNDIVYIAPGRYEEQITNASSGNGSGDSDRQRYFGDPNCEKFVDIAGVVPGPVRITMAAAATEIETGSSNQKIWDISYEEYITIKNVILDGNVGGTGDGWVYSYAFYNSSNAKDVIVENCVAHGIYGAYKVATVRDSLIVASAYGIHTPVTVENCVIMGGPYRGIYLATTVTNCITVGGYQGVSYCTNTTNCMAVCSYYGFYQNTNQINCTSLGCYYGSRNSTTMHHHYAAYCRVAYMFQAITAPCYFSQCNRITWSTTGDTPVVAPVISFALSNARKIMEAFEPWMFAGLNESLADDSVITSTLTDILGRNRRNTSTGSVAALDIGPYEFTTFSGSTNASNYNTDPPGLNIQGRGEIAFQVPVQSGSGVTATAYAQTNDSTYSPSLVLRGISLYDTQFSTNTDVGSSWANDTFQQLSVTTGGNLVQDEVLELVLSGAILSTSSFSDISITAT